MTREQFHSLAKKMVTISAVLAGIRNLGLTAYQIVDSGLENQNGDVIKIGGRSFLVAWNEIFRANKYCRRPCEDILILVPVGQFVD